MFDMTNYSKDRLVRLRQIIEQAMAFIEDEATAIEGTPLFPEWRPEVAYVVGTRVKYNDVLYKVLQDHTSQETWTPVDAPSLFAQVLIPDENVIPEWIQPGSTNPYMKGDKVTFNGAVYQSTIDNNVWAPDAYGWELVA